VMKIGVILGCGAM